eukprot:scaffold50726_cov34-Tisochrysis_lutea.AAC.3
MRAVRGRGLLCLHVSRRVGRGYDKLGALHTTARTFVHVQLFMLAVWPRHHRGDQGGARGGRATPSLALSPDQNW